MSFLRGNFRKTPYLVWVRQTIQLDSAAAQGLTFSFSGYPKPNFVLIFNATGHAVGSIDQVGGSISIGTVNTIYACLLAGSSVCLVSLAATVSYPFYILGLIGSR